jgi:pilus assembly protein CpaB
MRFGPLIVAVLLAIFAGFIALRLMGGEDESPVVAQSVVTPVEVDTANVYITTRYIPIGTVITADMLTPQPWPTNLVGETFVTDPTVAQQLEGQIARASFQMGEPISLTKVASADQGSFLAGALPKGMRAVTINTDETLGVAGFVFPGDKIDVLMTHRVPKWDKLEDRAAQEDITETLLTNVSVLAIDQIANVKEIAANNPDQQQEGDASTIHVPRTVTLMVNPEDGHKLRLAEKIGQLSMALRSIEDRETIDMATLTRHQQVTQFPLDSVTRPANASAPSSSGGGAVAAAPGDGVRIIRGVEASDAQPLAQRNPLPAPNNPLQLSMSATPATPLAAAQTGAAGASAAPAPVQTQ